MLVDRNFCIIIIAQLGLVTTRDKLILLKGSICFEVSIVGFFLRTRENENKNKDEVRWEITNSFKIQI